MTRAWLQELDWRSCNLVTSPALFLVSFLFLIEEREGREKSPEDEVERRPQKPRQHYGSDIKGVLGFLVFISLHILHRPISSFFFKLSELRKRGDSNLPITFEGDGCYLPRPTVDNADERNLKEKVMNKFLSAIVRGPGKKGKGKVNRC